MNDKDRPTTPPTIPCPGCGGSGQTSYFAGESRFMLTWEDCPDCSGTGLLLAESSETEEIGDQQMRTSRP